MKKHRLPENLKNLRLFKGLSQKEIAAAVHKNTGVYIAQNSYSTYERGFCEPDIIKIKALADFYEFTMDQICFSKFNCKVDIEIELLLTKNLTK